MHLCFPCPRHGGLPILWHDGPLGLRKPTPQSEQPLNGELVGTSLPSTCYPAPCLTACSWDPDLLSEMGETVAQECLLQKTDIILAPGVNIKRNPLCGRNFEYLSEDPLLAGKMAAGYIKGVQSHGVGVSLKHFAANNQEYRRVNYSADVDMRALRELYLKPFEIAIADANPWTVMCSYNKINGVYSADNDWLLNDVLRKEWNYDGVVMSDWGATVSPIDSHNHAGSSPASGTILKEKKPDCSDAVWLFLFLFIARDSRITISAFLKKWF